MDDFFTKQTLHSIPTFDMVKMINVGKPHKIKSCFSRYRNNF